MTRFDINIPVQVLTYDELEPREQKLVDAARAATARAYAPYSNFHVGAAIALNNGEIVAGANQENAAFSSGTCAERSACFYAAANWPDARFDEIAIAAVGTDGKELSDPISPCGSCRQSLLEYETLAGHDVPVLLAAVDRIYRVPSVKSLLPLAFVEF